MLPLNSYNGYVNKFVFQSGVQCSSKHLNRGNFTSNDETGGEDCNRELVN